MRHGFLETPEVLLILKIEVIQFDELRNIHVREMCNRLPFYESKITE